MNFLAITGWALDDHTEILSREELTRSFDVGDLVPNPAVFDTQKLEWMNGAYLRRLDASRLADLFEERLTRDLAGRAGLPLDRSLGRSHRAARPGERMKRLSELAPMVDFLFTGEIAAPDAGTLLGKAYRGRRSDAEDAARRLPRGARRVRGLGARVHRSRSARKPPRRSGSAPGRCSCSAASQSPAAP